MNRSRKRAAASAPERPITFRAAEELGAFELAGWRTRWQPIAIHGAMLAGARPETVAGALGSSLEEAYRRWREWALRQRNFIIGGKLGITEEAYEEVARRFASAGIKLSA